MAELKKEPEYNVGDKYQIPVEGSLGLLALGYRGVQMWREVRDAHIAKLKAENEATNSKAENKKG